MEYSDVFWHFSQIDSYTMHLNRKCTLEANIYMIFDILSFLWRHAYKWWDLFPHIYLTDLKFMLVFDQSSQLANLVEIRLAKKFSVCFSILVSSQALSKVFLKFKIWPRCIPMHILAWTDCVALSADKLWYRYIF